MKNMFLALLIAIVPMWALAEDTAPASRADFTLCTGGAGGTYEGMGYRILGRDVTDKLLAKGKVINTGGSVDNAEMLKTGECIAAIIQADVFESQSPLRDATVIDGYKEAIFWLHGEKGVDDFQDLSGSKGERAVVVVKGSGAEATLSNFKQIDKDYANVKVVSVDDWYEAATAAAQGYIVISKARIDVAGMVYIGRPGNITNEITADFGKRLSVGNIEESSFGKVKDANGNPIYFTCDIDSKSTNGIKIDNTFTDPETYCMNSQVVYNNEYFNDMKATDARNAKRVLQRSIVGAATALQ